jgi:O-antigen/teichoic acid export membrane protein
MGVVEKEGTKQSIIYYLGAGLGYFNKILLFTHFLSTDQVGLVNVFASISALFAQFALLGTPTITLRFFPFFQDKQKEHHGFFFWGNIVVLAGFSISSILFIFCKPLLLSHYDSSSSLFNNYYYYIIPLALSTTYYLFLEAYLRTLLKTVVSTILNEIVAKLILSACVALYALRLISFDLFVTIYVLSSCLIPLILFIYIAYLGHLFIKPKESTLIKRMSGLIINYGFFTILSTLGGGMLLYIDTIMVSSKLGLNDAGIYSTVFLLSTVLVFPYRSITKISHPIVSQYWKEKKLKEMSLLYIQATEVFFVVGGLLILLVWVNVSAFFSLMPKEYNYGKVAFLILCLGKYFDMVCGLNGTITLTSKKFKYDMYFLSLLVILTVVMNLIFIPIYGINGTALATTLGIFIVNIFRLWFLYRFFKMQPFSKNGVWIFLITTGVWMLTFILPTIKDRYISIFINTAIISILFIVPIILLKLSSDVNKVIYKYTGWKFLLTKENSSISN